MKFELGNNVECRITRIGKHSLWVGLPNGEIGKVPAEELSWSLRPVNLQESYHVGGLLRAIVHHLPPDGPPLLSLRRVQQDPWNEALDRFPIGSTVHAQVVRAEDYGVFAELDEAPGLVGLVHITQLGPKECYEKPEDAVLIGDHIEAAVTHVSVAQRRLSLSIRTRLQNIAEQTGRFYAGAESGGSARPPSGIPEQTSAPAELPTETIDRAHDALRQEARERMQKIEAEAQKEGLTILVVDDKPDVVSSLCEILSLYHYKAIPASDGEEAICLARELTPDAVLMDLAMKPLSGVEAMWKIREFAPSLPIMFMTGDRTTGDRTVPLRLEDLQQAYCLFRKPFSEIALLEKLDAITAKRQQQPPDASVLEAVEKASGEPAAPPPSLQDVLADILKQVEHVTGAAFLAFFEVNLATKNVAVVAKRGAYAQGWHDSRARELFRSPVRDVVESGRPCIAHRGDEAAWAALGHLQDLTAFNSCLGVCVPGGSVLRHALFLFDETYNAPPDDVKDQLLLYARFSRAAIDAFRVEQSLERSAKTVQIGQLADQLLHELTNELQALGRRASLAEESARQGSLHEVQRHLGIIKNIISDTEAIAGTFLVGSRSHNASQAAHLGECISRAAKTMALLLGDSIAVIPQDGCPQARAAIRPDALYHVLTNLILNAAQQIDFHGIRGGRVTISVWRQEGNKRPIQVRVEDNGPGIHRCFFEAVFERSFTTRPDGAGLGLHICRQLVQAAGGQIQVEKSTIFCGTTMLLEFPVARDAP